uniref:Uncharacterized protein n=1 Tax=Anguilla anguilla TaxID=7936 RepID=A0A0E9XP96_ANGAN
MKHWDQSPQLHGCLPLARALLLFPWAPVHQVPPGHRGCDRGLPQRRPQLLHEVPQFRPWG